MLCSTAKSTNSIACEGNEPGIESRLRLFSDSLHKVIVRHALGGETLSERAVGEFETAKKSSLVHSAVDLWVEKTRESDGSLIAF